MDKPQETPEETLLTYCEGLLTDECFTHIVTLVEQDLMKEWVNSSADEKEHREDVYHILRSLGLLVGKIRSLGQAREILAKNEELRKANFGIT